MALAAASPVRWHAPPAWCPARPNSAIATKLLPRPFRLPRNPRLSPRPTASPAQEATALSRQQTHTLLLVDDEVNIQRALARALREEGYRILCASSASEATELLAQHPVQVIVSDQRMPRCSGTEFLHAVKSSHPDTVRILLSGWGCDVRTIRGLAAIDAVEAPDLVIADYHLDDGTGIDAIARLRGMFGPLPAILATADRTPEVRASADREDVVLLNKPVKPAALRAALTRLSSVGKAAAE